MLTILLGQTVIDTARAERFHFQPEYFGPPDDARLMVLRLMQTAVRCRQSGADFCKTRLVGLAGAYYVESMLTYHGVGEHFQPVDPGPLMGWVYRLNAATPASAETADVKNITSRMADALKDAATKRMGKFSGLGNGLFLIVEYVFGDGGQDNILTEDQLIHWDHASMSELEGERYAASQAYYFLLDQQKYGPPSVQSSLETDLRYTQAVVNAIHDEEVWRHKVAASAPALFPRLLAPTKEGVPTGPPPRSGGSTSSGGTCAGDGCGGGGSAYPGIGCPTDICVTTGLH